MSCAGFFDDFISWAEADLSNRIGFAMVSNQANGVCSYTSGGFQYTPSRTSGEGPLTIVIPAQLEAPHAHQLFSDRAFAPDSADDLGVRITLSDPPLVRLQLNSWGGGRVRFVVECRDGLMVGFSSDVGFVISLQKFSVPK